MIKHADLDLEGLASRVLAQARRAGVMLATAESCTGGLIVAALTEIAGSSDVVDRGFITYSNEAKIAMLGVSPQTLLDFGAVSRQTALEMASGAQANSNAALTVSATGIAGPGGGSDEKPVGTVHIAAALGDRRLHRRLLLESQSRRDVRRNTVIEALKLCLELLNDPA